MPSNVGVLTRLIGRDQEVQDLHPLLLRPTVRLLTLTGPAGVGKTRLAQHLLTELAEVFPDGISCVPLASIQSSDSVLPTLLQTLGVTPAEDGALLDQLHLVLQQQRALLVLDNFEQVLAAAPHLVALLAFLACPPEQGGGRIPLLHLQKEMMTT